MKSIYLFLSVIIISLLAQSCTKFLDEEPVSNGVAVANNSSDSKVYKTASEVEAALAGAYSDYKNEYYQLDYFVNGDAQSDDAYAGGDNPSNFQIDDYKLDATNTNVSRDWAYLYSTIGKTNKIINNVDAVDDAALTAARKKEILGEASFKRGDKIDLQFDLVTLFDHSELFLTFMFYNAITPDNDIEKYRKEAYEIFESIRIE